MSTETKWSIDPAQSEITFTVRHLMISHIKGSFKTFGATICTTAHDFLTAEIELWIDPCSIQTGDAKRDDHLRGLDFFDVKHYKEIRFSSMSIGKPDPGGNHEMWGELTMKGITKDIKLNVTFGGVLNDPDGNERAGFTVTGNINRPDWGLEWNSPIESGGMLMSEEVKISCEVELTNMNLKRELELTTKKKLAR